MRRFSPWASGVVSLLLAGWVASTIPAQDTKKTTGPSDLTGTWKLKLSAPTGEQTATLVLTRDGKGLTGTYATETAIHGVKKLSIKGGELRFRVDTKFREAELTLTFKGTLRDAAIKGDVDFKVGELSGSFP